MVKNKGNSGAEAAGGGVRVKKKRGVDPVLKWMKEQADSEKVATLEILDRLKRIEESIDIIARQIKRETT